MDPKYKHILYSNDTGERLELQDAPQGWDATKFRLLRDLTYLGILKTISVEFDFVGDGFQFMQRQRLIFGVDANVIIRVYRRNPNEFLFEGKVNMENYVEERKFRRFKVDIIQSSFVQKFQNREDIQLNIRNTLGLDRQAVTPAEFHAATIRGRQIKFFSSFDGSVVTEPDIYSTTLPFLVKENGNEYVNTNSYSIVQAVTPEELLENLYNAETAIYTNRLLTPQFLTILFGTNITITYKGEPLPIHLITIGDVASYGGQKLYFRIAIVDPDGNIVTTLYERSFLDVQGNFNMSYSNIVEIPVGHSLVFACERHLVVYNYEDGDLVSTVDTGVMDDTSGFGDLSAVRLRTELTYNGLELAISTNSEVPDTVHNVLLPHELFSALIEQINGGEFYSEYFGREDLGYEADGEGAYLSVTTGAILRGISTDEIQFATSFREAFISYSAVACLGAIITDKRIQVEPLDKLFNAEIAVHLGEVNELAIAPTKEFLFNSVKAGYPVNEYEQQNGRDEFNTIYQYSNSLQATKKELDLVSKYCGDGYGIEFARRESVLNTGSKDTKYDGLIFFIDLVKDEEGNLMSRRLEGITAVSGIFSPQTAMNLRIAVGQNMLRHRKYLNIPLSKKQKVYYFQSKDKNTGLNLVTPLGITIDGEDINTGANQYFIPEDRKFKCPITIEQLFSILANPLGLVSYTYQGEKFFDHLFEVDAETDKSFGEWRMLGTKDTPIERHEEPVLGNILKYGDGPQDFVKYGDGPDDFILYQ